ncbi:MAG: methylenetetrahydrofolate reductase C-terminal domain-containing protein [Promethearchaeota archaeon]
MIITQLKDIKEISAMLEPFQNVLVVGCDGCCQPPHSLKEATIVSMLLELERKAQGADVAGKFKPVPITALRLCDDQIAATSVRPHLAGKDAVLSLSCGIGVQNLARVFPDVPVFPAQDTMFMGVELRVDKEYAENCNACGECLLGYTGAICPVARCGKSLMNGPCGGPVDGMCEVQKYTRPCAWIQIFSRLKKFNRLDLFRRFVPPRDYSKQTSPRFLPFVKPPEKEKKKEKK